MHYFSSHSRFPFYRSNIPIRGHEAHRPKNTKPVPSGSGSPLRAKYLSQVAAKTPSLSEVPSAGWVVVPPWGRGRGLSPGGSLHRCVERPPTKRRIGTRDTGAVQRRRQRPGTRPRSLPPHQKGTMYLVRAPQVVALEVAPTGKKSVPARNWGPHGEPPSSPTLPGSRKQGRLAIEILVDAFAAGTVNSAGGQWQGTTRSPPYWPSRDLTATHFALSGHGDDPIGIAKKPGMCSPYRSVNSSKHEQAYRRL